VKRSGQRTQGFSKLAAVKDDPVNLLMLVQEICRLLKEKEESLKRTIRFGNPSDGACHD
jgi:hypothetical protein